ncbi:DUF397 domain-containing protein [Sphaerisporangium fuscum]|uniref:DUF397 domain-containing protein n=1 Tax=Sphaerisporangium fuscum TaxID=2835868 RepID=UPI001BDC546F|nr:DUF397 domain-containing protein [Sphaerisporangium fuscum]
MDDVTNELEAAHWRKSSFSGGDGSNCVEVAHLSRGRRAVRDSKDHSIPALTFSDREWTVFLETVKTSRFA